MKYYPHSYVHACALATSSSVAFSFCTMSQILKLLMIFLSYYLFVLTRVTSSFEGSELKSVGSLKYDFCFSRQDSAS
uniref:Uncharacterized protein n=1 Tax=Rhizophora mucronata TaxID=61149 RepID=A0A2P2NNI8_RHIMU